MASGMSDDRGKDKSTEVSPMPPPSTVPVPHIGSSSSLDQPPTESLFTAYDPPSHYVAHVEASRSRIDQQEQVAHELPLVKKKDPYEEGKIEAIVVSS